jgi:hypothetical protein
MARRDIAAVKQRALLLDAVEHGQICTMKIGTNLVEKIENVATLDK